MEYNNKEGLKAEKAQEAALIPTLFIDRRGSVKKHDI